MGKEESKLGRWSTLKAESSLSGWIICSQILTWIITAIAVVGEYYLK